MAHFNLEALKRSGTGSSSHDYGFLVDQLDIKKNQLESDGKLSPGDYQVLSSMARKLYTNPGLTPAQRSNISVKISSYESDAKSTSIKDNGNLNMLDREVKDTQKKAKSLLVNSPEKFLQANADIEKAKIDKLTNSIDQIDSAMGDSSKEQDARDEAMLQYQDTLQALDDVQTKNPNSNYGAYIVTNSYGEITDLKVGKVGATTGYIPTNGTYGGLSIYGKINRVNDSGKNVFSLGNQNFIEGSDLVTGPDGVTSQKKLVLEGMGKKGFSVNAGKVEIDPTALRAQNEIRRGGWAEGVNGALYQKGQDGNYTKYINADPKQLGLKEGDILKLATSTEQSILPYSTKTVDNSVANIPPPMPASPVASTTTPTSTPAITSTPPTGRPNTGGAPTERSPQTSQGIAGGVFDKVKGFLGSLFGK